MSLYAVLVLGLSAPEMEKAMQALGQGVADAFGALIQVMMAVMLACVVAGAVLFFGAAARRAD